MRGPEPGLGSPRRSTCSSANPSQLTPACACVSSCAGDFTPISTDAPSLSKEGQVLLAAYAERFKARDFDGLREMLGQDVQLDLVARRRPIQRRGGEYLTNYAKTRAAHAADQGRGPNGAVGGYRGGGRGRVAEYVVVLEVR